MSDHDDAFITIWIEMTLRELRILRNLVRLNGLRNAVGFHTEGINEINIAADLEARNRQLEGLRQLVEAEDVARIENPAQGLYSSVYEARISQLAGLRHELVAEDVARIENSAEGLYSSELEARNSPLAGLRQEVVEEDVARIENSAEGLYSSELEARNSPLAGLRQETIEQDLIENVVSFGSEAASTSNNGPTDLSDAAPQQRKRKNASDAQAVPCKSKKIVDATADVTSRATEALVALDCEGEATSEQNDMVEQAQPKLEDNA